MKNRLMILLALCPAILVGGLSSGGGATAQEQESLDWQYRAAAKEYDVPVSLLKAIGYTNTRWEMPSPNASNYENAAPREGEPDSRGNYGIMSLYHNPSKNTLAQASSLTGIPQEKLKSSREANIEGAAAVLSEMAGARPADVSGWYEVVGEYGDGTLYADQVFGVLRSGASEEISSGERVVLKAHPEVETPGSYSAQATGDYSGSTWYGASSANYTNANRGAQQIGGVVIHVTQGSWAGSLNWFRDSRAQSSAHYTVRSSDGAIGQSVREEDIAWHAGNWSYNKTSIGIEHEGYVSTPRYFTDSMYRSSAKLTAYLSKKYNFPVDRQHIIGHNEVPGASHTDPGRYWDWDKYMNLVREYAGGNGGNGGGSGGSAYTQVVDNSDRRFDGSRGWSRSEYDTERYGRNYRFSNPRNVDDGASYRFKTPSKGRYAVYTWYPANSGYNGSARYWVWSRGQWKLAIRNQRTGGGQWVKLGSYRMGEGDRARVKISRRSKTSGYIIADAVKIKKL